MNLHPEQTKLLEQAEIFVQRFVEKRGAFTMFALVLETNEKITPVQPNDGFPDAKNAFVQMLTFLLGQAKEEKITACVICTPANVGKENAVVYDLEQKISPRVIAVQSYKKKLFGGWTFGAKEFRNDERKLFSFISLN
ncbi:MAG TPA: hypothetical protein VGM58_10915 [Verrucomicrobiae bacterium]